MHEYPPTSVNVKDHLHDLLNESNDNIPLILSILTHTVGMWVELRYDYKAIEIVAACRNFIKVSLQGDVHHQTRKKLETLDEECVKVHQTYVQAKDKRIRAEVEATNLVKVLTMSNAELAS